VLEYSLFVSSKEYDESSARLCLLLLVFVRFFSLFGRKKRGGGLFFLQKTRIEILKEGNNHPFCGRWMMCIIKSDL
jgi:hypothetical protein